MTILEKRRNARDIIERKKSFIMYLNRYFAENEVLYILEKAFGKTTLTTIDKRSMRHGYGSWLKNARPQLFNQCFQNWDLESLEKFKDESK